MIFVFHLLDHPDVSALRRQVRGEHVDYLAAVADDIAFAGPLLGDDGRTSVGSLLAIDFPDRETAERWIEGEPFTVAGIYRSRTIHPFTNLWPQKAGFPEG